MAGAALGLRLNVFERALTEPRIRRIARKMGLSHYDVLGRLNHLWMLCYQRRSAFVEVLDADIQTGELPGFIDAVIGEQLADRVDEREIRIRGADDALKSLLAAEKLSESQAAKGRKSGEKRREMSDELQNRTAVQTGLDFGSNHGSTAVQTGVEPISDLICISDLDPDPSDQDRVAGASGSRTEPPINPEARKLASKLMELVIANNRTGRLAHVPARRRNYLTTKWAGTIEKLNRVDGIEWRFIDDMIEWSQRDEFWRTVILGADALRSKWDTMAAQRARKPHPRAPGSQNRPGPTELARREVEALEAKENAISKTRKVGP